MRKQGFTLVELSIVLVIIGLLIGGILVAQSMISTVKLQREISTLSQWSIAFSQFRSKYNQELGISSLVEPFGNGNLVQDVHGSCPSTFVDEYLSPWAQLTSAGMLSGTQYKWNSENVCNGIYEGSIPMRKEVKFLQDLAPPTYNYMYYPNKHSSDTKDFYRSFRQFYLVEEAMSLSIKLGEDHVRPSEAFFTVPCTLENIALVEDNLGRKTACITFIFFSEELDIPLMSK